MEITSGTPIAIPVRRKINCDNAPVFGRSVARKQQPVRAGGPENGVIQAAVQRRKRTGSGRVYLCRSFGGIGFLDGSERYKHRNEFGKRMVASAELRECTFFVCRVTRPFVRNRKSTNTALAGRFLFRRRMTMPSAKSYSVPVLI